MSSPFFYMGFHVGDVDPDGRNGIVLGGLRKLREFGGIIIIILIASSTAIEPSLIRLAHVRKCPRTVARASRYDRHQHWEFHAEGQVRRSILGSSLD